MLTVRGNQRVAGFMIGNAALFLVVQTTSLAFGTGNDFLDCFFKVTLSNFRHLSASSQQSSFVENVCQIGARKTGGGSGDASQVNIRREAFVF